MDRDVVDLAADWTLTVEERQLVGNKTGATRLGFAMLLLFFRRHGRFPLGRAELDDEAIAFVSQQIAVDASELGFYEWLGRSFEYHRAQVRKHFGFRECAVADAGKLTDWLAINVCKAERRRDVVTTELLARCRTELLEPPSPARIDRIVAAALHRAEQALCEHVAGKLDTAVVARLQALVVTESDAVEDSELSGSVLQQIKASAGNVSLESMLAEIDKLAAVQAVGLPTDLFADIAPKVVATWRRRAMVESPSHLREHPEMLRWTLLAALLHGRRAEIIDALVELLIATVHRIGARAHRRVTEQLVNAFKKVTGKENILFRVAEAALSAPDEAVRDVVFPAVAGGEATLRDLLHEYKTKGPEYRRTVQYSYKASYTNHYRRGLIKLLQALEFRCNNTVYRPVLDALELVKRYADRAGLTYFPPGELVPEHRGVRGEWEALVYAADKRGRQRVVRSVYEICTFAALRDALRCKEIWVAGAEKWRNPDEDLPADYDQRRPEHYAALSKPQDAAVFIDQLRQEMAAELAALNDAAPKASWLGITDRGKRGAIKLTPLDPAPEPPNLRRLKAEIGRRWGTVPLIDMLKEAVLRTGCLQGVVSAAGRGSLDPDVLAERLILAIYAYGTNTGIRAVAAGGRHNHSEKDIRYVRARYLNADTAQMIAIEVANATLAARQHTIWGAASTAVASDSTHCRAFDQNLFTEWHARYGGRGVLIYWHVEAKSTVVHSQLLTCSASEVAAMIDGAIHHGTDMTVEGNYVDSHGQSEIGFGITRLLGFDLLPRIKRINQVRLYRPAAGDADVYPHLAAALVNRTIRWDLIADHYDQMIRYATAIRGGTASTEAILRRFMKTGTMHPTYAAMLEVGRAQKTIFVARYLRERDLQRQINTGLNVAESWNDGNSVLFYGKGGDIATNRRDEAELSMLCLRILQGSLVFVNTLMIQDVLAEPQWARMLTDADRRGLTPLFWAHITPYGRVDLDMGERLRLSV